MIGFLKLLLLFFLLFVLYIFIKAAGIAFFVHKGIKEQLSKQQDRKNGNAPKNQDQTKYCDVCKTYVAGSILKDCSEKDCPNKK